MWQIVRLAPLVAHSTIQHNFFPVLYFTVLQQVNGPPRPPSVSGTHRAGGVTD